MQILTSFYSPLYDPRGTCLGERAERILEGFSESTKFELGMWDTRWWENTFLFFPQLCCELKHSPWRTSVTSGLTFAPSFHQLAIVSQSYSLGTGSKASSKAFRTYLSEKPDLLGLRCMVLAHVPTPLSLDTCPGLTGAESLVLSMVFMDLQVSNTKLWSLHLVN